MIDVFPEFPIDLKKPFSSDLYIGVPVGDQDTPNGLNPPYEFPSRKQN
jgi:hypothetical protein